MKSIKYILSGLAIAVAMTGCASTSSIATNFSQDLKMASISEPSYINN